MAGAPRSFFLGFLTCLMMSSIVHQMGQMKEAESMLQEQRESEAPQVVQQPRKFNKTFDFPEGFVLPKTIYLVTGLESSGSNLVSDILAKIFKVGYLHAEFKPHPKTKPKNKDVWIQHMSLPSGPSCEKVPVPYNVTTLLPGFCNPGGNFLNKKIDPKNADICRVLGKDANVPMTEKGRQFVKPRIFLDIIGTKEWWESLGVEVKVIIIVRDTSIARIGRRKHNYCSNETLLLNEEEFGTDIIRRAIEKYIMPEDKSGDGADSIRRRLSSASPSETAPLPMGNGVVLVSFESLIRFKETYVKMIYKALGIESDYMPLICDANARYVEGYKAEKKDFNRGGNKLIKSC